MIFLIVSLIMFTTTTAWTVVPLQKPTRTSTACLIHHYRMSRHCSVSLSAESLPLSSSLSSSSTTNNVTGITLKIALDQNGGVAEQADTESVRFTCPGSLDMVHRLRRDSGAVLVGRGTVERDDCSLLVRRGVLCDKQPLRVILDPTLSLLLDRLNNKGVPYQVFEDGYPTVIYHHRVDDVDLASLNLTENTHLVCLDDPNNITAENHNTRPGRFLSPRAVVHHLKEQLQVDHIMVEGGPKTALYFLQEKLIDRAIVVKAPIAFKDPYPSGITAQTLTDAGLVLLGTVPSGVDTMEYWSRLDMPWPSGDDVIASWP